MVGRAETGYRGGGRRMRSAMRGVGTALRPTRRAARIHVRVSPSDKKRIEVAARGYDLSLTDFMLQAALYAAEGAGDGARGEPAR